MQRLLIIQLGEGFHALEVQAWGEDTTLPFYYVTYLSTAPEAQRKGLGAALIRGVVERAKGEGKDAVLLTQNLENVSVDDVGSDSRSLGMPSVGSGMSQSPSLRSAVQTFTCGHCLPRMLDVAPCIRCE